MHVERELKVVGTEDAAVPDLTGVIAGITVSDPMTVVLDAWYFDTDDLALTRAGASLRVRTGEAGSTWTVKLPTGDTDGSDGSLSRRELRFDPVPGADPETPPPEAVDAVFAYRRGRPLRRIVNVVTQRCSTELQRDGAVVATLSDDRVHGWRRAMGVSDISFRELEVELSDDTAKGVGSKLLGATRERLREAGWHIDDEPRSKVARVIGDDAGAAPDVVAGAVGRTSTVREVVHAAIAGSVDALVRHDAGTRLGLDPEDLHQFRVATRRLRSDLRTFRSLLDADWVTAVRSELGWLAEEVGAVRDLDVLHDRLAAMLATLDPQGSWAEADAAAVIELQAAFDAQRGAARAELAAAMSSDRYRALLDRLVDAARAPMWRSEEDAPEGDALDEDALDEDAKAALPALVRRSWKKLRRAAKQLGPSTSDDELHEVRILAKRCRYASEAASSVCGRDARRFATAVKDLQSVLGDHHDTVVAEEWLRRIAAEHPSVALVAGLLIAAERAERARLRSTVASTWAKADRRSLRAWLR